MVVMAVDAPNFTVYVPFVSKSCQHHRVHRLLPPPVVEVDTDDAYRDSRPMVDKRPWLMINMISTIDGVTEVGGISGPLGGPGDKDVFGTVRTLPDIIIVGSTTAVAENYTPPSSSVSSKARRLSGGAWPVARVAVVSRSLNFDLGLPLFARQGQRPIVVTTEDADPTRLRQGAEHADVLQCGRVVVDFSEALHRMADLGAKVVLSEGGPSINGSLIAQDLVDEVLISISPRVGGGESGGIARGVVLDQLQEFVLRHVLTEDHFLFLRYVRQTRDSQPHSPSN